MESIGSTFLMTFILVMGLFYFITAHSLSVIARKTDHGDTAEILAYIPGLQIFPTLWVGGMSVFRTLLIAIAFGIANALLTVAASKVDGTLATAMNLFATGSFAIALWVFLVVLGWRTAVARGLPGFVGLLSLVPIFGFLVYPIIAFHDGWEPPHKIGATLGLLLTLGMAVPLFHFSDQLKELSLADHSSSEEPPLASDLETSEGGGEVDTTPMQAMFPNGSLAGRDHEGMPDEVPADHEASIRALFALQERFDDLDALVRAKNLDPNDRATRSLALIESIRGELAATQHKIDPETHQELSLHLIRIESKIQGVAPHEIPAQGRPRVVLAQTQSRRSGTGQNLPAAPADTGDSYGAPTRPLPVNIAEDCPTNTELRSRKRESGEEEWCQQFAEVGGLRHGWYARYLEGGRPEQVGEYRDGLRVGVWTRFYEDGRVRAQAQFEAGLQHGWLLSFAPDGQRQKAVRFDRGAVAR